MALGATLAPQTEQPNPLINGRSGGASPQEKPTHSPELGQEPLSSGPNKGLRPSLSELLSP
jgi:hypothetical protein